jgi:hypothetical protein
VRIIVALSGISSITILRPWRRAIPRPFGDYRNNLVIKHSPLIKSSISLSYKYSFSYVYRYIKTGLYYMWHLSLQKVINPGSKHSRSVEPVVQLHRVSDSPVATTTATGLCDSI